MAFPSYWVFALGFLLWGLKGALASGALEALVYEELERVGAEDRYGTIMGRAAAAGTIGVVLAMALAAPALAVGGYAAVGVASAVVSLLTAAVAAVFPEHRKPMGDAREDGSFTGTLRAGTVGGEAGPVGAVGGGRSSPSSPRSGVRSRSTRRC